MHEKRGRSNTPTTTTPPMSNGVSTTTTAPPPASAPSPSSSPPEHSDAAEALLRLKRAITLRERKNEDLRTTTPHHQASGTGPLSPQSRPADSKAPTTKERKKTKSKREKSVTEWKPKKVAKWLQSVELGDYAKAARKKKVDGAQLIKVAEAISSYAPSSAGGSRELHVADSAQPPTAIEGGLVLAALGLKKLGHLKRLQRELKRIKEGEQHGNDYDYDGSDSDGADNNDDYNNDIDNNTHHTWKSSSKPRSGEKEKEKEKEKEEEEEEEDWGGGRHLRHHKASPKLAIPRNHSAPASPFASTSSSPAVSWSPNLLRRLAHNISSGVAGGGSSSSPSSLASSSPPSSSPVEPNSDSFLSVVTPSPPFSPAISPSPSVSFSSHTEGESGPHHRPRTRSKLIDRLASLPRSRSSPAPEVSSAPPSSPSSSFYASGAVGSSSSSSSGPLSAPFAVVSPLQYPPSLSMHSNHSSSTSPTNLNDEDPSSGSTISMASVCSTSSSSLSSSSSSAANMTGPPSFSFSFPSAAVFTNSSSSSSSSPFSSAWDSRSSCTSLAFCAMFGEVAIKCLHDDDISLVRLNLETDLTFAGLQRAIQAVYGTKKMRAHYFDSEGDKIRITADSSLRYAYEDWRQQLERSGSTVSWRLHLKMPRKAHTTASSVSASVEEMPENNGQ